MVLGTLGQSSFSLRLQKTVLPFLFRQSRPLLTRESGLGAGFHDAFLRPRAISEDDTLVRKRALSHAAFVVFVLPPPPPRMFTRTRTPGTGGQNPPFLVPECSGYTAPHLGLPCLLSHTRPRIASAVTDRSQTGHRRASPRHRQPLGQFPNR